MWKAVERKVMAITSSIQEFWKFLYGFEYNIFKMKIMQIHEFINYICNFVILNTYTPSPPHTHLI